MYHSYNHPTNLAQHQMAAETFQYANNGLWCQASCGTSTSFVSWRESWLHSPVLKLCACVVACLYVPDSHQGLP
jgi:hypothetical protein